MPFEGRGLPVDVTHKAERDEGRMWSSGGFQKKKKKKTPPHWTITNIHRRTTTQYFLSYTMTTPNPYILAADHPSALLNLLRLNPSIASSQDEHGYSLLHAAASYGHIDLLRALVKEFHVDTNLIDEDGETCLFVTETEDIAKCLVEELGVDYRRKNDDGLTARETIENDGSFPEIAAYLRTVMGEATTNRLPPPPPPNVQMNVGAVSEQEASAGTGEADPVFRRRIEDLAARDDFDSEDAQNQLRELVKDAIAGGGDRDVRRRTD